MDHKKALDKAKIGLMDPNTRGRTHQNASPVFYSSILFSMKHIWTDDIPTAAVDGYNLFINPVFFLSLTPGQRIFLLAHECLHPAYHHLTLFTIHNLKKFSLEIEHKLYNMAGDYVINGHLIKAGYDFIPGGCHDTRFDNKTTLQVYKILHDEYSKSPTGIPGMGKECDIIFITDDGSAKKEREIADLREHVTHTVARAKAAAEMSGEGIGCLPAEIKRALQDALNPLLPFEIMLINYMTAYAQDDYSFSKPNRRFMPDFYLPAAHSPSLCEIACAFDVSGSVKPEELNSFGAGVRMIQEILRPEKMTIIEFDTKLHGEPKEITRDTRIQDIEFHGGGGTNVTPVFQWAINNQPEVILIFTDGGFTMPNITVPCDIIWIIHGNPNWTADNGKVFHYQL